MNGIWIKHSLLLIIRICLILLIVAFFLCSNGCVTNLPEYISKTPSEKFGHVITLFDNQDVNGETYSGIVPLDCCPNEYFEQNVPYCGGFSIAALLSAYGLYHGEPIERYMSDLGRLVGGMLPNDMINSLDREGIQAELKRAFGLPDDVKLQLLRDEIDRGVPVTILVGNGYEKSGIFSSSKSQGATHLHWVTIWGYHDEGFFIYDSVVHPYHYQPVPIGNVSRSNEELLRDWVRPFYLSPFIGNTYITIDEPQFHIKNAVKQVIGLPN